MIRKLSPGSTGSTHKRLIPRFRGKRRNLGAFDSREAAGKARGRCNTSSGTCRVILIVLVLFLIRVLLVVKTR